MMRHLLLCSVLTAVFVPAQSKPDAAVHDVKVAKLRAVLANMLGAGSLEFTTGYRAAGRFNAFAARGARAGGGPVRARRPQPLVRVRGVLVGPVLYHSCNEDKHTVAAHGRRRIARFDKRWEPVVDRLANGLVPPFLFDPEGAFRLLSHRTPDRMRTTVGTSDDVPVEIYTLTFVGEDARQLGFAGLYPVAMGSRALRTTVRMGRGGPAVKMGPKIQDVLDVALYVEPGKRVIRKMRIHSYQYDSRASLVRMAMRGRVARLGGGADDEEEDADEEKPLDLNPADLKLESGLPVRTLPNMPKMVFDVTFKGIHTTKLPELSARAKKLLGL